MKPNRLFTIFLVILAVLCIFTGVAYAQGESPSGPVNDALAQFAAAIGLGGVVSTLVQVLKSFDLIPDGYGGQVTVALNLLIFISATVAGFFGIDVGDDAVKQSLMVLGQLVTVLLTSILYFKGMRAAEIPGFGPRQ